MSATLSISRAPRSVSNAFTVSCAVSHILRQAIRVITGLLFKTRAAGDFRNAVIGSDGDRNHTWYVSTTRSYRASGSKLSGLSAGPSRYTDSGKASKKVKKSHGNG